MSWQLKYSIGVFFVATMIALSVRLIFIENYRITSDSMFPSLLEGDLVFVSKLNYNLRFPFSSFEIIKLGHPKRAEIVLFSLPDHGAASFIKRVVAVEGDRVAIRDGILSVNGVPSKYEPDPSPGASGDPLVYRESFPGQEPYRVKWDQTKMENYGPVDIPEGYFFVLGDNRLENTDSRTWGPIPNACLKGKLAMVWLSFEGDWSLRKGRFGLGPRLGVL